MKCTVFAPASVANVAVGFDILGFALDALGDVVTVTERRPDGGPDVRLTFGTTSPIDCSQLPIDPACNTAGVALTAMRRALDLDVAYDVEIEKGIPIASGLGGSAASAVGAVVAANALLTEPLSRADLLAFALCGESAASGAEHADNVAPSMLGGLIACVPGEHVSPVAVPLPTDLHAAVVQPNLAIETRAARMALPQQIDLAQHVLQNGRLAGFLLACQQNDIDLLAATMLDDVVEPTRSRAIPGFDTVRQRALRTGAICCSISGSGPSMFAWARSATDAKAIAVAMCTEFEAMGIAASGYHAPIRSDGAVVLEVNE